MSGHTSGGGSAVNDEYRVLLGLGGITEAQVRQTLRCNGTLRRALGDAMRELPGVFDLAKDPVLGNAASYARGEQVKSNLESVFNSLSEAARGRIVKGAELPSQVKSWAQLARRAAEHGQELLISTLVMGEQALEAAAQSAEQLEQTEIKYARLSAQGQRKVVQKSTTFGEAVVAWPELANYAKVRNEVVELSALVSAQYTAERAADAKRQATQEAPAVTAGTRDQPAGTLHTTKPSKPASVHAKRESNNHKRRTAAGKAR